MLIFIECRIAGENYILTTKLRFRLKLLDKSIRLINYHFDKVLIEFLC